MKLATKKLALVTALTSSLLASGVADAKYYTQDRVDYARVISVQPVTKMIETSSPVQHCWDEQVAYHQPRQSSGYLHKKEVLGAVIGAAMANQAAKRSSNRKAVTVAGALLGGALGNNEVKKNHYANSYPSYRTVKQCETTQNVSYTETVVAYKVRYKYRGQEYTTRTQHHPGDRIKVKVSVTPVFN